MRSGIYCYWTPDGRRYVGASKDVLKRKSQHEEQLRAGTHTNEGLRWMWSTGQLRWSVIEYCPVDRLHDRELYWWQRYGAACVNEVRPEAHSSWSQARKQSSSRTALPWRMATALLRGLGLPV